MVYASSPGCLTSWLTIFRGLAIASLAAMAACRRSPPTPAPSDLQMDVVGCAAVKRAGGAVTCELPEERDLRVVLRPGAVAPRASGERPADGAVAIDVRLAPRDQDGPVLSLRVPDGVTTVVVAATVAGRPAEARFTVTSPEEHGWLAAARAARANGDFDRARALASEHMNDPTPSARALARGLLARIALMQGRADDAFPLFREAIELHRSEERVSDAVDDSFALVFALHQRSHRYTEARAVLDALGDDLPLYAEGRARAPYYRGALAAETGDRRSALSLFREAQHAAHRLGMAKLERNARAALALELQEMGRARDSLPLLEALEKELEIAAGGGKDAPSACERVEIANNRGWGALLAKQTDPADDDGVPIEDPRASLERALSIEGCADAYVRGFASSNLARLALDAGDFVTAERRLAEARAGVKEPRGTERVAWLELEGRILLGRGRARDALRVFDDALSIARAGVMRLHEWSLLVSRADALAMLHRPKEAVAALRSAEDVLDDAILLVPLGEGRGAFVRGRSRSARALVGLLVKEGKPLEAAQVAERAHARVLASALGAMRLERLTPAERARWEKTVRAFRAAREAIDVDAANDWKLPADRLERVVKARRERERELHAVLEAAMTLLHRAPRPTRTRPARTAVEIDIHPDLDGFLAVVRHERGVTAYRVGDPRDALPEDLAGRLLDPLAAHLDAPSAETLVVVRAYGRWRSVDVHALPWRGEPLIANVPVVYSVGLGDVVAGSADESTLVVGDPTGDLPAALDEARAVANALRSRMADGGVQLLVRDHATSSAVIDGLHGVAQLHYAGHGVFAGDDGWESALPLAAGGRLSAPDILALSPAPRTVVLTGCEAAKSTGVAEGLGLAQAFIVAGSQEVLAPVRRVPDAFAARIARALYRDEVRTPLHLRAREALLELRRDNPSSDWAAFRVLVP